MNNPITTPTSLKFNPNSRGATFDNFTFYIPIPKPSLQRSEILRNLRHGRGLFNRTCPPEILLIIFEMLMHDALGDETTKLGREPVLELAKKAGHVGGEGASSVQTLLRLAHVCLHWRSVATLSPSLWCKLRYTLFGPPDDNSRIVEYKTPMRLGLLFSREMPLTLFFAAKHHGQEEDKETIIEHNGKNYVDAFYSAFKPLLDAKHRWKHIRIDSHLCVSASSAETVYLCDMPLLEDLSIRSPLDLAKEDPLFIINLNQSSQLRTLHLNGDFSLETLTTTLSKLRSIQLFYREDVRSDFPSVKDVVMLISAAPQLEVLQVDIAGDAIPAHRIDIHSEAMKTFGLRVNDETDEAARYLLDSVTFPNLLTFEVDIGRGEEEGDGPQSHIEEFLRRSNAPLETFVLCSVEIREENIYQLLELMPQLVSLWFEDVTLTEDFIKKMTLKKNAEKIYCPLLEQLLFRDCDITDDPIGNMDLMALMVSSRRYGVHGCLEDFTLSNSGWKGLARHGVMQACVMDGLMLHCS